MCFYAEMFGISDHDLMFVLQASKAIEGDAEADDENNVRFIEDKVKLGWLLIAINLMLLAFFRGQH